MSVRPTAGAPNPGRGGDGRRRMWSESPIPRPGVRRVRTAGVPPVTVVGQASSNGANTGTYSNSVAGIANGDLVVYLLTGMGLTVAAPAGWTVDYSGTIGFDLHYVVCHATHSGGLSYAFTVGGTPASGNGWESNLSGYRNRGVGTMSPTLVGTVGTATAATSIAYKSPAAAAIPMAQFVGFRVDSAPTAFGPGTNLQWAMLTVGGGTSEYWPPPFEGVRTGSASVTQPGSWFSMALGLE